MNPTEQEKVCRKIPQLRLVQLASKLRYSRYRGFKVAIFSECQPSSDSLGMKCAPLAKFSPYFRPVSRRNSLFYVALNVLITLTALKRLSSAHSGNLTLCRSTMSCPALDIGCVCLVYVTLMRVSTTMVDKEFQLAKKVHVAWNVPTKEWSMVAFGTEGEREPSHSRAHPSLCAQTFIAVFSADWSFLSTTNMLTQQSGAEKCFRKPWSVCLQRNNLAVLVAL